MLHRVLKATSNPRGETIDRTRMYEITSEIAFLGRRRQVYRRLVALGGARPGEEVLDIGCNGGYQARLLADGQIPDVPGRVSNVPADPPAHGGVHPPVPPRPPRSGPAR